jgi:hypothetical protein
MRAFIIFYVSLELGFHFVTTFLSKDNPRKWIYIYLLSSLTTVINQVMFFVFVNSLRMFLKVYDENQNMDLEQELTSKMLSFKWALRYTLMFLWWIIFTFDNIFDTFLRPGGNVNFMGEDMDNIAKSEEDSAKTIFRKFLQINQNISLFIIGMFVIQVYSFFGKKYYDNINDESEKRIAQNQRISESQDDDNKLNLPSDVKTLNF